MKRGNLWTLRMQGTSTEGTFGSLSACMRAAYLLTDAELGNGTDWEADSTAEIA